VKCTKRQEFVVGGYTEPKGTRAYLGSLLLGYYDNKRNFVYCGHVGTGFDSNSIRIVYDRLKELQQDHSPFASPIKDRSGFRVHWTSPRMVVEVKYSTWTDEGLLRHPSFIGIREDKSPRKSHWKSRLPRKRNSLLPKKIYPTTPGIQQNPTHFRPPQLS